MDTAGEIRELVHKYRQVLILAVGIIILFLLRGTIQDTASRLIFLYLFAAIAYRVDGRIPVAAGLVLLVTAALLVGKGENFANQIAIYAYYFLVIGVVLQLVEYIKEGDEDAAPKRKPLKVKETPAAKSTAEKPRCIAIASGKGGVGKTTIAANLGIALAKMGKKTTVVDLDLAMPNLEIITGLKAPPVGLIDVLEGNLDLSRVTYIGPEGVRIIPPGVMLDGHRKDLKKVRDILKGLPENNDYTILDLPPGREAIDPLNEGVESLLIVNPTKSAVLDALNMKVLLENKGYRVIGAVLNRAKDDIDGWVGEIEKTLDIYVVGVIPESREVKDASSLDQCFVSTAPECGPSKEVMWLAEEVVRISLLDDYPKPQKDV